MFASFRACLRAPRIPGSRFEFGDSRLGVSDEGGVTLGCGRPAFASIDDLLREGVNEFLVGDRHSVLALRVGPPAAVINWIGLLQRRYAAAWAHRGHSRHLWADAAGLVWSV
jgi:hypothetical protein